MLNQITPLLLTFNEEANIARTLDRLRWAREVVVIDSGSTDRTLELIAQFSNARVLSRDFDSHAQQWNFGLQESGIKTAWVLALDADYVLTDEFINALRELTPVDDVGGYKANFRYCIHGKKLRGSLYPAVTVLYRFDGAHYLQDGHTQRIVHANKNAMLSGYILHDDRKLPERWLAAQVRYARLELVHLMQMPFFDLSWPDRLRRLYVVMPVLAMMYCLFVKGGILDGRAGLVYAMQRSIAEAVLSLVMLENLLEIRN
ncbi:MAG: glycosyltransferase family 2 protein [Arenimonas sp.]